jgi:hypothetical protein
MYTDKTCVRVFHGDISLDDNSVVALIHFFFLSVKCFTALGCK